MAKKISIVVPFHWMDNWRFLLNRCLESIEKQTFKDYEIIMMKVGSMPETSNRVIESAQGEFVKILYMDDFFTNENSLHILNEHLAQDPKWLVTGCLHDDGQGIPKNYHQPAWNDRLYTGTNSIGSPSVLTMKRESCLLFDTSLSWLLDVDLYKRLYDKYGSPKIVNSPNVIIGLHEGQTSNLMSNEKKQKEYEYVMKKYE